MPCTNPAPSPSLPPLLNMSLHTFPCCSILKIHYFVKKKERKKVEKKVFPSYGYEVVWAMMCWNILGCSIHTDL
jgi:hypothetical protein